MNTVTNLVRTYEHYLVRWTDGATWCWYDTEADAVRAAGSVPGRVGEVVRETYEVTIPARLVSLARPGIAERVA